MIIRDELNCILVTPNRLFEVTELTESPETSNERSTKVTQTGRLAGVTIRGEVDGILVPRNCLVQVSQLPEAVKS